MHADGGAPTSLAKLPSPDWAPYWPSFLPDGRRFLFTAKLWTRTAEASEQGVYLGSLDSPTIERLLSDLSSAVYAPPGYLVFVREGALTAAPFDLAAGRVTGPPVAIGGAVATDGQFYFAAISVSGDGTLAVRPPPTTVQRTISRLMPRRRKPPSQSWRTFLKNHLGSTVAVDFFAVPTLTCRILFVFVVLAHDRRRILHVNVTGIPPPRGPDSSSATPSQWSEPISRSRRHDDHGSHRSE